MILRKPYAILIKYFKLIHIIMFISFSYLIFPLQKIYIFFKNYIINNNFTYVENMADKYVPWILIVIVFVLLGLAIGILLLMNKKEKPVLFYKVMIVYCIFLVVMFIYYMVFFKSLDRTVYETLRIAINRDIILFAYIFNYFFVAFTFIRGFGFDIKKFSFDRDKKELNLEESDNEEYELNVNLEKEDIRSFINRHKREFKYYTKENKKFFTIAGVIILLLAGLYIYYDFFVINRVYKESDTISIGSFSYHVNSSKISNISKYGEDIGDNNDYLILSMNIKNYGDDKKIDSETLRINIDKEYYYPSSCDLFSDIGTCYKNQNIKSSNDNEYIFVYKIKKDYKDIFLEILKNKDDEYKYSRVKLSYTKDNLEKRYSDDVKFVFNDIEYTIDNYSLSSKTSYEYEECEMEKCTTYTKKVLPNNGEMVLTLQIMNSKRLSDEFLSSAIGIRYINKLYYGNKIQLLGRNKNYVYYSVPIYVREIDSLDVLVMTRPILYIINLKGANNE